MVEKRGHLRRGRQDLPGLRRRRDRRLRRPRRAARLLAELGISCLWLLPIMRSPWRDNGYDVSDYFDVDRRLGTLGDLVELLRAARERGVRVITDLVVNHTSDEHPWFQAARSSRDNPYRDYYVWRDEPQPQPEGIVLPGEETSNWELDQATGQYYLHRFYKFQPDLNIENPSVRAELQKIMGFWMELGFSGFRVDAAPFLIETDGIPGKSPKDPHAPLRHMREFLARRRGDAILLGEANVAADQLTGYFGRYGNELHMLFNFILNQALCLSLAREDARGRSPSTCASCRTPRSPASTRTSRAAPTSCRWTDSRPRSGPTCSPPSRPRSACSSMAGASVAGSPPCSAATGAASSWPTACCSAFPTPRCCCTARRSAWERIWTCQAAPPCERPSSGRTSRTAVSPPPSASTRRSWPTGPSATSGSTSAPSGATRTRCSAGLARSSARARSARSWGSGRGGCWRPISRARSPTRPTGPAAAWPSCTTWLGRVARSRWTSAPPASKSSSPTAASGRSPNGAARSRSNRTAGAGSACTRPADCFRWRAGQAES